MASVAAFGVRFAEDCESFSMYVADNGMRLVLRAEIINPPSAMLIQVKITAVTLIRTRH